MSKKTKKDSELQGISHLLVDATIGITDLVEDMHKQIVHPSFSFKFQSYTSQCSSTFSVMSM